LTRTLPIIENITEILFHEYSQLSMTLQENLKTGLITQKDYINTFFIMLIFASMHRKGCSLQTKVLFAFPLIHLH